MKEEEEVEEEDEDSRSVLMKNILSRVERRVDKAPHVISSN